MTKTIQVAVLAMAACAPKAQSKEAPGTKAQATPAGVVSLKVVLPGSPLIPDVPVEAVLRVENGTARPVGLTRLAAQVGSGVILDESLVMHLMSLPDADGRTERVLAALSEEDIGPAARAPAPPRWTWQGKARLATLPVLKPGEVFARTVTMTPGSGAASVDARVHYIELDPAEALSVSAKKVERVQPSGGGFGWKEVARLSAAYGKSAPIPDDAMRPVSFPDSQLLGPLPTMYPTGLYESALARQKAQSASTNRALSIQEPALALAEARRLADVAEGASAYFPSGRAWALEGPSGTVFVSPEGAQTCPGLAVELVRALNASEPVRVTLFQFASSEDPDGLLAAARARGLAASGSMQKGGTWAGEVALRRTDLLGFCEVLRERGLKLEGLTVAR